MVNYLIENNWFREGTGFSSRIRPRSFDNFIARGNYGTWSAGHQLSGDPVHRQPLWRVAAPGVAQPVMATTAANLTSGGSTADARSLATAWVSPSANNLELVAIAAVVAAHQELEEIARS